MNDEQIGVAITLGTAFVLVGMFLYGTTRLNRQFRIKKKRR
jgi:hypothetical protein